MKPYLHFVAFTAFICFMQSCNIINPSETIPTYVHIDSFTIKNQSSAYGTRSQKITHVWAYYNNSLLGAYSLPANIPVDNPDGGIFEVAPGVDINGLGNIKTSYPFFIFDSLNLDNHPGEIVNFIPETAYSSEVAVPFNATFEFSHHFTNVVGVDTFIASSEPQYVFEGNRSGLIKIRSASSASENVSLDVFKVKLGDPVYLEINYKCNINFQIGLVAYGNQSGNDVKEYLAGVNKKEEWNKLYINVKDFISAQQAVQYGIIIRAGTDNGEQNGYLAIDNIKVVTLK